jgi:hypothetical protein
VALKDAGAANEVFLAGTVISHLGASVKIRDEGHAIATSWASHAHKPSACFFPE